MKQDLKVSLLQMTSSSNPEENFQTINQALSTMDSRVLFVPENSLYMKGNDLPIDPAMAFYHQHPIIKRLAETCQQKNVYLHLGGIAWKQDSRVVNCAVIIHPDGSIEENYTKIHLFDLDLGTLKTMESASFAKGNKLSTFTIDGVKFATLICYDLRFAELFAHLAQNEGVDVFVIPSAFTARTGEAHWHTLVRARAIESQCYVIAPAQVGGHWNEDKTNERKTWGQSMIVDPWGRTLVECPNHNNYLDSGMEPSRPITCLLEKAKLEEVRKAMPMATHRAFTTKLEPRCLQKN